jgi:hypothetical protein
VLRTASALGFHQVSSGFSLALNTRKTYPAHYPEKANSHQLCYLQQFGSVPCDRTRAAALAEWI